MMHLHLDCETTCMHAYNKQPHEVWWMKRGGGCNKLSSYLRPQKLPSKDPALVEEVYQRLRGQENKPDVLHRTIQPSWSPTIPWPPANKLQHGNACQASEQLRQAGAWSSCNTGAVKHQLLVHGDHKTGLSSLCTTWTDYKKVHDSMLHWWILESLSARSLKRL